MILSGLLTTLQDTQAYTALRDVLLANQTAGDAGLLRAARPYLVAALAIDLGRTVTYLTDRVDRAYNITEQLPVWSDKVDVLRFAEPGPLFFEYAPWSETTIHGRLAALAALCPPIQAHAAPSRPTIVVSSARALMQKTLPMREFRAGTRVLKQGGRINPEKLLRTLLGLGYLPATITTTRGQLSRRGGIVDVFPITADRPVRIEFFGDEIESLRLFDPASQRSDEEIAQVIIPPAREALPRLAAPVAEQLAAWFASQPDPVQSATSIRQDADRLAGGTAFPELEYYLPYLYSYPASLLDYVPQDALLVIDDYDALHDAVEDLETQALELRKEKASSHQLPPDYPLPYLTWDEIQEEIAARRVLHLGHHHSADSLPEESPISLNSIFAPGPRFGGQIKSFLDYLFELRYNGQTAIIVTRQAQRIAELWGQQGSYLAPTNAVQALTPGSLQFVEGALAEGWTLRSTRGDLHLLTDAEIFGWKRPEPRRIRRAHPATPEEAFADLQPGDYVVHIEYGIGRFTGLQRHVLNGSEREYLVVQYAGTDQLYVPIHQADRLARYVGPDDRPPQLSRLGTPDWSRVKERTRKAVEDVAQELLQLYARRANVNGHAFSPDTPWQHELEASFPYLETEDQLRAIEEVKADMEQPQPMDRLICGDVGYGKTEVALRAAFKAVMDGKQVAILVPTTVLAQQHFNTFVRRLAPFPVKVEMLSRFRDRREQQHILYNLAQGQIDIVIGTHRLLQPDVTFKDLGLLIIDEEQRFGVTHKEQLKQLRTEVDVLTMTATPIPRTLYMALTGIRDISTIQTAPQERLPVNMHIGIYDKRLVRQAILREMERGGQVFFVHNRVQTIDMKASELRTLVPEARIEIAHGQMDEQKLEQVMLRFMQGEFDLLVSTTIIESGLDIPSANTLIVDRADQFGLAQLYQLRGRVGRGAARAYAYFFHPRWNKVSDEARARLETIKEQTALGAGFHIAMRDLELRGAGDILGTRQSGQIAAVGFHLYTQMLAQAVSRLKTSSTDQPQHLSAQPPTVTIDLPLQAYIPTDFIPDMALRLQLYRRLADLHDETAIEGMREELGDRFGPLPEAVEGLLYQLKVKLHAQAANATAVGHENGQIFIRVPYLAEIDRPALQQYLENGVRVSRTAIWLPRQGVLWQERLLDVLARLSRQPHHSFNGS